MDSSKSGLIMYTADGDGQYVSRGATYGRTSYVREIATNQTSSVDAQMERAFQWLPENLCQHVAHAWDNSVSASQADVDRVGFYKLVNSIITREIEVDTIVVKDWSRLLRNDDDQELLEYLMKEHGVRLVGVGGDAPITTRGPGSKDLGEVITWKVMCEVYKHKKQENQENQRLYTEERIRSARPMTSGVPPFGHRFTGHRLTRQGADAYTHEVSVIDEKRELNRVRDELFTGSSLNAILMQWNDRDGEHYTPGARSIDRFEKLIALDDQDWSRERLERMMRKAKAKASSGDWSMTALKHTLCAARQIGATEEPAYDPANPTDHSKIYFSEEGLIEANYELGERDLRAEELAALAGMTGSERAKAVKRILENLTLQERQVRLEAQLRKLRAIIRGRSDVSSRPLGTNGINECSGLVICSSCAKTMVASTCAKNDTYRCPACSRSVRKDMIHEFVAGATLDWLKSGELFQRLEETKRELGIDDLILEIKDDEQLLEMLTRDAARSATAYRASQPARDQVAGRIEHNQRLLQARLQLASNGAEDFPKDVAERADWYWEHGVPNDDGMLPTRQEVVAFRRRLNHRAWKAVLISASAAKGRAAATPEAFAARVAFVPRDDE